MQVTYWLHQTWQRTDNEFMDTVALYETQNWNNWHKFIVFVSEAVEKEIKQDIQHGPVGTELLLKLNSLTKCFT